MPETLGDILVRAGRKGQKTGGGWYDYAPGDRKPMLSAEANALIAPQITPGGRAVRHSRASCRGDGG